MNRYGSRIKKIHRPAIILIGLLIVSGAVLFGLEKAGVTDLYTKDKSGASEEAKTTSTTATAQEDFDDGEYREPGSSLNEHENSGAINDTAGDLAGVDTSQPLVSKTGEISVYSPHNDSLVTSGYQIAGASSLPLVYYRLFDSVNGLVSEGELKVIDGKFSGTLIFDGVAEKGRLSFYGLRNDGAQFSNVDVQLRFK